MWIVNFQMFKLVLEKAEEPEIKLPTSICWIIEKAIDFQKNIYFCFIDYAKAFDYVDHDNHTELLEVFLLYTGCFHASVPLLQLLSLPGRYPAHPVWETPTQLSKWSSVIASSKNSFWKILLELAISFWFCQIFWKILKEMGTPDHLTCLLRNLYAGQ